MLECMDWQQQCLSMWQEGGAWTRRSAAAKLVDVAGERSECLVQDWQQLVLWFDDVHSNQDNCLREMHAPQSLRNCPALGLQTL